MGLIEPYINMPTSYVNKMPLDTLNVIVETQHATCRPTLEVVHSTLQATTFGDQARKITGKHIILADPEGLRLSLFSQAQVLGDTLESSFPTDTHNVSLMSALVFPE